MIREICPNLFQLEIPLPGSPLKALNAYVIKDPERSLIVDTGMHMEECKLAMLAGLTQLEIDLNQADFFITHMHKDHLGLVVELAGGHSKVYFNAPDAEIVDSESRWQIITDYTRTSGFAFPISELEAALESHPGYRRYTNGYPEFTILEEGDILTAGGYRFCCVETPGHSRGHLCLYEADKRILISGDHILAGITPNISQLSDDMDALHAYLQSLNKIAAYDVDLVLPGHRAIFTDCRGRIKELKEHHWTRAEEVLSILDRGPQNAYQVASKMRWDLSYASWNLFPIVQQWFATAEAAAHLHYLEKEHLIEGETSNGKMVFFRC